MILAYCHILKFLKKDWKLFGVFKIKVFF